MSFTESGVKSSGLGGTAYGNPLTVAISSTDAGVLTEFAGRAELSQMGDVLPFALPQQLTGATDFTGRINSRSGAVDVTIDSALVGVTSSLPAPLAKRADEPRKLRLTFVNTGQPDEKINLTLAGNALGAAVPAGATPASVPLVSDVPESRIDANFQRRYDNNGIAQGFRGGMASVGVPAGAAPVPEGLWFSGVMPVLDFDLWRQAFENFYPATPTPVGPARAGGSSPLVIAGFDFKLGGLIAYGRPFDKMTLKGRHAGEDWRLMVDSEDAVGDISWRAGAFSDRGAVRARLQKLVLADEVPTPPASALPVAANAEKNKAPIREADFPALDIIADKFTFKDRELGKLELRATPLGDNWRIDELVISTGHAKLEMDGLWQRYGDPQSPPGKSRTQMNLKLNASNLNALFNQFGFGDYVKGGNAKMEGQLSWPGHAYQFQTATLSGQFKVTANDGRFAKIDPGAGKLLGLMSLQSLPRRITLDFRDIFSEGLAFNKIEGDVKIASGVMFTDNFEIRGPAAFISTAGEVSLPTETVKLKMKVAPLVGEGAAIGAGIFLTPIVGLGVYGLSKLFEGALSYELSVTGPWDDPQSEVIKKNAPSATALKAAETNKKTP
ncbi:MAG: AsmA-like C-terminal region-containing protein [Usitatibacteraceae bacterium]